MTEECAAVSRYFFRTRFLVQNEECLGRRSMHAPESVEPLNVGFHQVPTKLRQFEAGRTTVRTVEYPELSE